MSELKAGDKVRVLKKSEFSNQLNEIGQGIILSLAHSRTNEPIFAKYLDRETKSIDAFEWLPITSSCLKLIKY